MWDLPAAPPLSAAAGRTAAVAGTGPSLRRLWAYAQREAMELRRDPIRLAFALLGPVLLMIAMGYGISFDVRQIHYAVLDYDRSPASRACLFLEVMCYP